ncbi:MAG: alpha/beta hydrolase domain-containing protein [Spongiibacteraceae bacterium]
MALSDRLAIGYLLAKMAATGALQHLREALLRPPPVPAGIDARRQPLLREIPIAATSLPFMSAAPLPEGYAEREFGLCGAADYYDFASPGSWELRRRKTAGYWTRILVRYPREAAFNGTVLVDWFNVTLGADLDGEWMTQGENLAAQGFAYVGVTVQRAGANTLARWNPQRYAGVHIWDDGLSYEIFSQVGRLIKQRSHEILGDLAVRHVIAGGASQSAIRLTTYINAFHPRDRVFDGYMVRGRGFGGAPIRGDGIVNGPKPAPIRSDIDVPVMIVQNEGDLLALRAIYDEQPDGALLRVWEIAGSAHGSAESTRKVRARVEREGIRVPARATSAGTANCLRSAGVGAMAYRQLQRWVATGEAPPSAPRIERARMTTVPDKRWRPVDPAVLRRDEVGNVRGGIRLPDIEAPLGQYLAYTEEDLLGGAFRPFNYRHLSALYPTHADYVSAVRTAAVQAVTEGFIEIGYAERFIREAISSAVPHALPPHIQQFDVCR